MVQEWARGRAPVSINFAVSAENVMNYVFLIFWSMSIIRVVEDELVKLLWISGARLMPTDVTVASHQQNLT